MASIDKLKDRLKKLSKEMNSVCSDIEKREKERIDRLKKSFRKEYNLSYNILDNGVLCLDLQTVKALWSKTTSYVDMRRHFERHPRGDLISWEKLQERRELLKRRLKDTIECLDAIDKVLKDKK